MTPTKLILLIALFLTLSSPAYSQVMPSSKTGLTDEEIKAQKDLERQGYQLLLEAGTEIGMLKSDYNRARSFATVAGLLWKFDEARAKQLIAQAEGELQHIIAAEDFHSQTYGNRYYALKQLRSEMFQEISPLDPELALDFLHATKMNPPAQSGARFVSVDPDADLELQLAMRLVKTDPHRALEIGEAAVAAGPSYQAVSLLGLMNAQNPEAATALLNGMLTAYQSGNFNGDFQAFNSAVNLLQMSLQAKSNSVPAQTAGRPQPLILDDASVRKLVSYLSAAADAMKNNAASGMGDYYNLQGMLAPLAPQLQKFGLMTDSIQAAILAGNPANPNAQAMSDYQTFFAKNPSVDAWLQAAPSAPISVRDNYYQQASFQAVNADDFTRARLILNDNITDQQRSFMLDNLDFQIVSRLGQKGNFDEARQVALSISKLENRVNALLQLSHIALQKKNPETALSLLDVARSLLNTRPENSRQVRLLLSLAQSYTGLNPAHALEILEPLPGQLNLLISASVLVGAFQNPDDPSIKDGELTFVGGSNISQTIQQISVSLARLSRDNFSRAKEIADHFQPVEIRVLLHLSIARGALTSGSNQQGPGFISGSIMR